MIINDNKGGKERVTNGKIFDEEIITDTNSSTLKQNILTTPIIVAKASNVSVNNTDDYIVKYFLHDMNNKHKIEREEENKETEDIHTIKQKSSSTSNEEIGKIVVNTFNYKSIEEKMDILNTKRNNSYVTVIDKHTLGTRISHIYVIWETICVIW